MKPEVGRLDDARCTVHDARGALYTYRMIIL